MYQPKVNNIQKYSDRQGEHIVHEGKLVFIKTKLSDSKFKLGVNEDFGYYKPIIISETEEIEVRDYVYDDLHNIIGICDTKEQRDHYNKNKKRFFKVLALPEHFSPKHLQAIVDEKMIEGKVLIKTLLIKARIPRERIIHLDKENHITLFPVKQSLEEAIEIFIKDNHPRNFDTQMRSFTYDEYQLRQAIRFGAEWAKKNNYN